VALMCLNSVGVTWISIQPRFSSFIFLCEHRCAALSIRGLTLTTGVLIQQGTEGAGTVNEGSFIKDVVPLVVL